MDRIDAMAAFVAVADHKGFAAAARQLAVSPPTVTRLVASLEERLGLRLLARTTRSLALTDAGRSFLPRARRLLVELGEAEAEARAEQREPTGRLAITAPSSFGRRHVVPLVGAFRARFPQVAIELRLADRAVHLVDEGVDVAVRIGQLEDSSLRVRPLGATRRVLVASPAYLARAGRPRRPADLAAHETIQFSSLTPLAEWTFGAAARGARRRRSRRVAIKPLLVTNSAEAAVASAEAGGGIALVLAYQAADAVAQGRLEVLLSRTEPPPLPIQLVHAAGARPSSALRAFIDLAASTCRWDFTRLGRTAG